MKIANFEFLIIKMVVTPVELVQCACAQVTESVSSSHPVSFKNPNLLYKSLFFWLHVQKNPKLSTSLHVTVLFYKQVYQLITAHASLSSLVLAE